MKQWTRTAPGQFILWLFIMLVASVSFASGFASLYMASMDFYSLSESELEQQAIQLRAYPDIENLTSQILYNNAMRYKDYAENQMDFYDIAYLCVVDRGQNDKVVYEYGDEKALKKDKPRFEQTFYWSEVETATAYGDEESDDEATDSTEFSIEQNSTDKERTLIGPYTTTAVYDSENRFATELRFTKDLWSVRY